MAATSVAQRSAMGDAPSPAAAPFVRRGLRRQASTLTLQPRSDAHVPSQAPTARLHLRRAASLQPDADVQGPASAVGDDAAPRMGQGAARTFASLRHNRLSATMYSLRFRAGSAPSPVGVSLDRYDTSILSQVPKKSPKAGPFLPAQSDATGPRPTLVLDLDETLVHSTLYVPPDTKRHLRIRGPAAGSAVRTTSRPDFSFKIGKLVFHVAKRPGVDAFLRTISKHYEIVLFSASSRPYVDACVKALDPSRTLISAALSRSCCTEYPGGYYVKDLSKLGRNLATTVIVDNSVVSFILQPENAVLISSWVSRTSDTELSGLYEKLIRAADLHDVRRK